MAKPTSAHIVEALRRDIINGTLPPGIQVRQEVLAEQFGVSRAPVREALRQLEVEGLISSVLHKGAFVTSQTLDEVLEMLDIRIALELRALKLALPNLTDGDIKAAARILDKYDGSETAEEWRDLNLEFHLTLYQRAGRPRLVKMIKETVLGTHHFMRAHISSILGREKPQTEHRELLHFCAAKDAKQALAALEAHIERTKVVLIKNTRP